MSGSPKALLSDFYWCSSKLEGDQGSERPLGRLAVQEDVRERDHAPVQDLYEGDRGLSQNRFQAAQGRYIAGEQTTGPGSSVGEEELRGPHYEDLGVEGPEGYELTHPT